MAKTVPNDPSSIIIKNIGERQHPQYAEKKEIWEFLMASYRGGMGMQNRTGMTSSQELAIKPSGYYAVLIFRKCRDK